MSNLSRNHSIRVQWPYKHLWNLLRGESILADYEVILGELRLSYEQIVRVLTQYKLREGDLSLDEQPISVSTDDAGKTLETITDKSTTEQPETSTKKDDKQNESKLSKRISVYLDLEETAAWELFCSYMMFEYKGGSTSFEKLLNLPRVSTEFLTDLKAYYLNERISVLLCVQALFGYNDDTSHKYNHIFKAFSEWADDHGIADLTENLLKSLELVKNDEEEIQTLHALTLLMYQMPHLSLKPFASSFKGFTPGRKEETIQAAEAVLIYNALLLPAFEEEWPDTVVPHVQQLVLKHAEDLLTNKFCVGAIIATYVNMCQGDRNIQNLLTTSPFPSAMCLPSITELAHMYSDPPMQQRHNLPVVVLKSLYYAVKAIFEKLGQAVPRFGTKSDFYEFLTVALEHKEIAIKFLTTTQDLMDLVTDAMMTFPIHVKHMLDMWGSMCAATEDSCVILDDCVKLVTFVSELSGNSSLIVSDGGIYRAQENFVLCGVRIPKGTEAILSDDIITWDIKSQLTNSIWSILYHQVIEPIVEQIDSERVGGTSNNMALLSEGVEGDNIRALITFLKKFSKVSNSAPTELHDLYEPAAFILLKGMEQTLTIDAKAEMVADIVEMIAGGEKLGPCNWTWNYVRSVWPACDDDPATIVSQLIMGYESVAANQCKVTLAFLDATLACFHEKDEGLTLKNEMKLDIVLKSIYFINENILHSFTRWRIDSQELKCKVLLRCLRIYNAVFRLKEKECTPVWLNLRLNCSHSLLASNSSLMASFNMDEEQLQNSVIKPNKNNYLMPEIIYESLGLLLNLFKFRKETIQLVDASLGLTLVQKLGHFARHRLDYKIPTLAMALLKKIAEELNMSLLPCFGSDEVAFRDLILQRLEFRSEDIHLKVAILDFLTVAAFRQPGLTQYVFMDDFLIEKIIELPSEKDESLALSVLTFIRALVQKGAAAIKKCKGLWANVFTPIRNYQPGGRLRIIAATLQITTIEIFRNGLLDAKFAAEMKWFFKESVFVNFYKILVSEEGCACGEDAVVCLRAFKQFITVVLHRNDMNDVFDDNIKEDVMRVVSSALFDDHDVDGFNSNRVLIYIETMSLLVSYVEMDTNYLGLLSKFLLTEFSRHSVNIKISLLYLTQELLSKQTKPVELSTTENIIRTVYDLFDKLVQALHNQSLQPSLRPIIMLGATIVSTIISKGDKIFPQWVHIFGSRMLTSAIILAINQGINWPDNAEIIGQLVLILRSLIDVENGAVMLQHSEITNGFLLPIIKYAESAMNGEGGPWGKIYILAINIMSQLMYRQKFYFFDQALAVWGVHGGVIWKQLISLSNLSQDCVAIRNPEGNFKRMRNLLTFNVVSLDAIHAMLPFHQYWKQIAPTSYHHLMVAVFGSLQTAINLLEQPTYLHTVINSISASPTRSPHITELQAKLWEVVYMCSHIMWKVRSHMLDFVMADQLRMTVNQVTQACIKALSKVPHGAKSVIATSSTSVSQFPSASSRTAMTLKRNLALIHYMATTFFSSNSAVPAVQKRLLATDVTMMADGVKRVSGHTTDPTFCLVMMNALEELIKNISQILYNVDSEREIVLLTKQMSVRRLQSESKKGLDKQLDHHHLIGPPLSYHTRRRFDDNLPRYTLNPNKKAIWVPSETLSASEKMKADMKKRNPKRPLPMRCLLVAIDEENDSKSDCCIKSDNNWKNICNPNVHFDFITSTIHSSAPLTPYYSKNRPSNIPA